jgi:DNA mismatch repair protein MutS
MDAPNLPISPTICRCFRAAKGVADPKPDLKSRLEEAIRRASPDAMTPREALEALYRLKALLASEA